MISQFSVISIWNKILGVLLTAYAGNKAHHCKAIIKQQLMHVICIVPSINWKNNKEAQKSSIQISVKKFNLNLKRVFCC